MLAVKMFSFFCIKECLINILISDRSQTYFTMCNTSIQKTCSIFSECDRMTNLWSVSDLKDVEYWIIDSLLYKCDRGMVVFNQAEMPVANMLRDRYIACWTVWMNTSKMHSNNQIDLFSFTVRTKLSQHPYIYNTTKCKSTTLNYLHHTVVNCPFSA